jgi:hypothetical protein
MANKTKKRDIAALAEIVDAVVNQSRNHSKHIRDILYTIERLEKRVFKLEKKVNKNGKTKDAESGSKIVKVVKALGY